MGEGGGGLEPGPYLLGARFSLADVRLCADVYAPEPSHCAGVPGLPEAQGRLQGSGCATGTRTRLGHAARAATERSWYTHRSSSCLIWNGPPHRSPSSEACVCARVGGGPRSSAGLCRRS